MLFPTPLTDLANLVRPLHTDGNMWLKVRSMWKYAYQHHLNEFDLFHIGGDDHFLIPDNLRAMVDKEVNNGRWNLTEPLFLGGSMIDFPMTQIRYCGGGSGYTLNRAALKLLIEQLFDTHHCRPHFRASDEDRLISNCFRSAGIHCMDTNDELGESRYHQASADYHAQWTHDQPSVWHADDLEKYHGIVSKDLLGQISESSVSFHLKEKQMEFQILEFVATMPCSMISVIVVTCKHPLMAINIFVVC